MQWRHVRGVVLAFWAMAAWPASAQQPQPFDMSPERQTESPAATQPPPAPEPPATIEPQAPQATPAPEPPPVSPVRYLIPFDTLQLTGETARQGMTVFLTDDEAQAPVALNVGYLNAVVAAPEASELRVDINGTNVLAAPISSSAATTDVRIDVPAGTLRPGPNLVEFSAVQRHRTDCSVASTYELWTRIDPSRTFLSFGTPVAGSVSRLADLAATGFDDVGETVLHLVAPDLDRPEARQAALALAQALGLALRVPDTTVEIADGIAAPAPGALNVVLATADALPAEVASLGIEAKAGPVAAFAKVGDTNVLVVSGPDWAGVDLAVRAIGGEAGSNPGFLRSRADLAYPIPLVTGSTEIALADLGVQTSEFNGRRFTTSFEFALPSDFYSNMFGQATLLLNAAYSSDVLPESQFNIYVNDQIASSTPVLRTERGFSRDTPIKIPMTNFRAGRNRVDIEVLLHTAADEACPPGLTQTAPNRFLLSANSRLQIPDFGRIAVAPDLAAFAGTGAPYVGASPQPVVVAAGQDTLASGLTWLTRVAVAAGEAVPVIVVPPEQLNPAANALVVSPLPALSAQTAIRSGVAQSNGPGRGGVGDDALLDSFRSASGNGGPFEGIADWLARQFDLQPQDFWPVHPNDADFVPKSADAVIMSQVHQPEGGIWTYLTIPDEKFFLDGTRRLVRTDNWRAIAGRISTLGAADAAVTTVRPNNKTLIATQPPSLANYRLIAANWLSANVMEFTLLLAGLAVLLTLATWALLKTVGRKG